MTNLDSILKSRDIILPTKVHLVKAMVFPVVTYGRESWTIRKAEHRWVDAFELWCWRRLLRVPWTARRSNQSILKEISPGYSLEGLMLKLKLQHFGHWWEELTHFLDAGKDWRWEEKGPTEDEMVGWRHWLSGQWVWVNSRSWWWTGKSLVLQSTGLQGVRPDWVTVLNWTELTEYLSNTYLVLSILNTLTHLILATSFSDRTIIITISRIRKVRDTKDKEFDQNYMVSRLPEPHLTWYSGSIIILLKHYSASLNYLNK